MATTRSGAFGIQGKTAPRRKDLIIFFPQDGPDRHSLESQELDSPFAPREWPEPDVGFVIHAVAVWQQFLPTRSHRERQILRSVVAALKPLQAALNPHRCIASQKVAQNKNAAFVAFAYSATSLARYLSSTVFAQGLSHCGNHSSVWGVSSHAIPPKI